MEPMRFSTGRDALDATIKRAFSIRSATGLWKCGQGKRLDHSPTGEQKQKKRTFHVLLKPDKLISYRHRATCQVSSQSCAAMPFLSILAAAAFVMAWALFQRANAGFIWAQRSGDCVNME